jgi:putative NIF3 family GTP cyclohydrolase 1 type 2
MTAREFTTIFEGIAPLDSGVPGDELGFVLGDPDIEVTGVGCMWCLQTESIEQCVERGFNLIISHERSWLPAQDSPWYRCPDGTALFSQMTRSELLSKHHITVYRSHSNWDALPVHGIADSAITCLDIPNLKVLSRQKFFSVLELEEPWSVTQLVDTVEKSFGFSGCRVFGKSEKMIRRFSILVGGFGENQSHMPQVAMELGAEAIIIGEMSEFIVVACLEMGLPVIETLHSVSEIPGIKSQANLLAERIPSVRIEYIPSGAWIR